MKISKIFLYDEPAVPEINQEKLSRFIEKTFGIEVEARKNIFNFFDFLKDETCYDLASCRLFDTRKPFEKHVPSREEIDFEKKTIGNSNLLKSIVMYDGFEFQKIITKIIPENELVADNFHLVITNKLTCTYDYNDYRYHGRAVICSNPSIISTTGIIEAPAKPREYYRSLMTNMFQGLNVDYIKKKFQGTCLDYHDSRISNVVEGYAMQALFYYLTGEPFCESKECRLHNAHWQHDLLYSQIQIGKLCTRHQKILDHILV
ncbi:MAG: DUF6775 family putative metallopeptidase [Nitrosopumilaceae archaeon]